MAEVLVGQDPVPLDANVRVVAVASEDETTATRIASVCDIATVVKHPNQLPRDLDGVLVMERNGSRHLDLARPFLEAGQFVYIDKPVCETRADLEQMQSWAERSGSRLFGGSALRYSEDLARVGAELAANPAESLVVTGPGPWYEYACHTVEILTVLYGSRIHAASALGSDDAGLAIVQGPASARATIQWGHYPGEFRIDGYTPTEHKDWRIADAPTYYRNLMHHLIDGVMGRVLADPVATAATVGVLEDVGRSLQSIP